MTEPTPEYVRRGKRLVQPCYRDVEHPEHPWGTVSWCEGRPTTTDAPKADVVRVKCTCSCHGIMGGSHIVPCCVPAATDDYLPAASESGPHATHPNHWARHGHPDRPCPPDGSCYGGADRSNLPG